MKVDTISSSCNIIFLDGTNILDFKVSYGKGLVHTLISNIFLYFHILLISGYHLTSELTESATSYKKKSIQEATQESLDHDSGVGIISSSPVKANRYFREHTASKTSVWPIYMVLNYNRTPDCYFCENLKSNVE